MNTLAALAGVPASTISRIEAGKIEPTLSMLERIVQAAGFSLTAQIAEAGNDQPFASFIARLRADGIAIQNRPLKELLTIASLTPLTKRAGVRRLEMRKDLKDVISRMNRQQMQPIVSSLEAFNSDIASCLSFIPVIYTSEPEGLKGFELASANSARVLLLLPATENVYRDTRVVDGTFMVSPEWGILDALASPGRQPDAALEALSANTGTAA
jgi:transcriptional regulator with XRE-family HTH domain